jgi:hypothetical protein
VEIRSNDWFALFCLFPRDKRGYIDKSPNTGTFVAVYKFLLNALPMLPIYSNPPSPKLLRKKARFTSSPTSTSPSPPETDDLESQPISKTLSAPPNIDKHRLINSKLKGMEKEEEHGVSATEVFSRLAGKRRHAFIAGAIGGLGVMWEKKERRGTIAQQLFVRCGSRDRVVSIRGD